MDSKSGLILDIQRMSTEDGPGIRTTVFFKGCNLSCAWCHNPESIPFAKLVLWVENRCIGCGSCAPACENGALLRGAEGITIDRDRCIACLACAEACPAGALEAKGAEWDAKRLAYELMKDAAYFGKSGGGVTLSGGEVLLQPDFAVALLETLKAQDIHTAVDTAGNVPYELIEWVMPHTDLILYDIKLMDAARHTEYAGCSNALILQNLKRLAADIRSGAWPGKLWIRTPVIPGATADKTNIAAIASFIAGELGDVVAKWELCAFNNLCRGKYRLLGIEWPYRDTPLLTKEEMDALVSVAVTGGVGRDTVTWSGPTAVPSE